MTLLKIQFTVLTLLFAAALRAQEWPVVPLPKGLPVFDIAQQMTVNALPMRLQGFVSPVAPEQLVTLIRQSMGQPVVETISGKKRVLGRVQGEFYISVQVEPAGAGSRGTTAVTHLKAAFDSQEQTRNERELLLGRLLPGSRVLSVVASQDGPRSSRHVLFSNSHTGALNRERLKSIFQEQGLVLSGLASGRDFDGETLFFKGRAAEAMATIQGDPSGQTMVVFNVVTSTERLK